MRQNSAIANQPLTIPDGEMILYRNVFTASESALLFQTLYQDSAWQQHVLTICGRVVTAPRLSAWYGDRGASYRYSGLSLEPLPWAPTLREIKERAERLAATRFNSVLLNLYRDGRDSIGWHSDAEPELGRNPVIASVSLGATRRFLLRHKEQRNQVVTLMLEAGSVLIMAGTTQHYWQHQLPKTRQAAGPRINLTFRVIM